MSFITLTETQSATKTSYVSSGVGVVVPLLYKDTTELTTVMPTKNYTSADSFKTDFFPRKLSVDGSDDHSYLMIHDLLTKGFNVWVEPIHVTGSAIPTTKSGVISALADAVAPAGTAVSCLEKFKAKNTYDIKFITVGAYESTFVQGSAVNKTMTDKLISIAANRQDCVAIVDLPEATDAAHIIAALAGLADNSVNNKWATTSYPWCLIKESSGSSSVYAPSSWYLLTAYAESLRKGNPEWILASGIDNGIIPGFVSAKYEVSEALQQALSGEGTGGAAICSNSVMNCGAYGHRVMGDSVLYKETATDGWQGFLSVRLINTTISKVVYLGAYNVMYNPNDDVAWAKFKTFCATELDKMKSGRGIGPYRWDKKADAARGKLIATLKYRPLETIKSIELTLNMTEESVGLEEI